MLALIFPKMKGVGENDVAENIMRFVICDIDSGIHLKIWSNVPGKPECG